MRFLKTFFRFCTITILCTTFTTVAWGAETDASCDNYYLNKCNERAGCYNNSEKRGDDYCMACTAGHYCPADSSGPQIKSPTPCPAGTYNPNKGESSVSACLNCPAGTYRSSTGGTSASSCSNCAPGEYSNPGAAQCTKCPGGYYQNAGGQRQCNKCPDGTTTKNTGSTDSSQCIKKFNLKLYAEYQENGTTKQTLVSDSTHSFYAGDLNLFSGYTAQQVIGGKLGSAPLNNKWEYKPNTDKAYITVNGTNYNLAYNGTNWFWKSSNDMSILDTQAGDSTFNLVFILTPKTYNVYMLSASTNSGSSMVGYDQPTKDIVVDTEAIANKNFGAALSAVTPNTAKVQTCAIILGYGGLGGTTTYSYGYIADTATPTYYECTIDGDEATIYLGNNYKKTTIFEPSVYGRHICVGYVHTTCEAGYSCNSCDRTACTTGTYQDATGQSSCKNCSAGSATNGSTTSCTPCGVGTYSSGTANASCTTCAAGTYQDATGQSSCKNCSTQTSNKYPSSAKGSDNINDCYVTTTAGKYVAEQGKGEVQCACGGYCVGGTVVYYSSGVGSTTGGRSTCGAGKYNSNTGSTTSDACKITSAGYYATTGSCNQTKVNAGCYGAAGSTSACPHNCPSDTAGRTATSAQGSDAATDCYVSCGAKTISDGTASVVSSTINYNGTSYPACTYNTNCNAGYYGPDGVTDPSCSECADGKYSKGDATTCSNCAEGEESNADKTGCSGCAKGTYRTAEMTTCDSCPKGTYQDSTGQPSCKSCEDGTTKVTSSPNGIFTTTEGATAREDCCFKSSLTLTDALGDLEEQNFSNVCWVGNGRIR